MEEPGTLTQSSLGPRTTGRSCLPKPEEGSGVGVWLWLVCPPPCYFSWALNQASAEAPRTRACGTQDKGLHLAGSFWGTRCLPSCTFILTKFMRLQGCWENPPLPGACKWHPNCTRL